jgi:iron(III) transport system ATP-binding protein
MSALEVRDLSKSFGRTEVLRSVDLSVPERSITAVLGASGSGKSTLLRIVAGLERPQTGRVTVAGRVVDEPGQHVPAERRRMGYVPQEGALFPHLTVARNVGFGLPRGAGRAARVRELLTLVGLPDLDRRYPHELSGGQQQRVALARALAVEPPLVLLDEPFSSLDAALRGSVRAEIARLLHATGTAAVLVTHDQEEALSIADQVAVLRHGRIVQVGSPREIYTQPVDAELAGFLGDANLVDAELVGAEAVTALGPLSITPSGAARGTVLVRPEQISIEPGHRVGGLTGHVVGQTYQGHDSLITVRPETDCGATTLLVRSPGAATYADGAPVTLRASGPAVAWPVS